MNLAKELGFRGTLFHHDTNEVKLCDNLFCAGAGQAEDTRVNKRLGSLLPWPSPLRLDGLWPRMPWASGDISFLLWTEGRVPWERKREKKERKTVEVGIHPFLIQRWYQWNQLGGAINPGPCWGIHPLCLSCAWCTPPPSTGARVFRIFFTASIKKGFFSIVSNFWTLRPEIKT